jgi:hypothetical protein
MAKKIQVPVFRQEAEEFLQEKAREILEEMNATAEDVGFEFRYYHELTGHGNALDRIAIGHRNHADLAFRPHFEIVFVNKSEDWKKSAETYLRNIANRLVRISNRRKHFDPHNGEAILPKKAWDVDPATATILKLCNKFPVLDGKHRISGDYGKVVSDLKPKGFKDAKIAYGDGLITLIEAEFNSGDKMYLQDDRICIEIKGQFPEAMILGVRNKKVGDVVEAFRIDRRASETKITKVRRKESGIVLTLADKLFPLDATCKGDEPWRQKKLAA